jgi:hypothetical protein
VRMRLDLSLFYTELSRLTSTHFGEGIVIRALIF